MGINLKGEKRKEKRKKKVRKNSYKETVIRGGNTNSL